MGIKGCMLTLDNSWCLESQTLHTNHIMHINEAVRSCVNQPNTAMQRCIYGTQHWHQSQVPGMNTLCMH